MYHTFVFNLVLFFGGVFFVVVLVAVVDVIVVTADLLVQYFIFTVD